MEDRLEYLKKKIKRNKIYYSSYNPQSEFMQDIEDAREDFLWMLFEIEKLRDDLERLKRKL
jgi:hypothetical protein